MDVLRALRIRSFLIQSFSQSSIFKSLTHEQVSVLASCVSDEIRLAANQRLIKQGDTSDRSLYIIRDGTLSVVVSRGEPLRSMEMARVGPGSCVGEMALLQGKPRSADVVAVTGASVLRLQQAEMEEVMQRYPQIRFVLDGVIKSRVDGIVEPTQFKAPRRRTQATVAPLPRCINTAEAYSPTLPSPDVDYKDPRPL